MKVLITGAKGMVGTALTANLCNIRDGKNKTRPHLRIDEVYEYDLDSTQEELNGYCEKCDFVFHLAAVHRPKDESEFMRCNFGFTSTLLDTLKKHHNKATVMMSSSIQATLIGRYGESDYGKSKLAGEELLFQYGKETGAKVAVYRFPHLMGHGRPNYNSVISTFCYSVANDKPYRVDDPSTELELLYIGDLIEAMLDLLEGKEKHCEYDGLTPLESENGRYCYIPTTHRATLGRIVDLLLEFKKQPTALIVSKLSEGSFEKKLYSLYLTYLPNRVQSRDGSI